MNHACTCGATCPNAAYQPAPKRSLSSLVKEVATARLNSLFAFALVALFATQVGATAFVAKSEIENVAYQNDITSIAMAHHSSSHVLGAYTQVSAMK